jgi:hypothetical protein
VNGLAGVGNQWLMLFSKFGYFVKFSLKFSEIIQIRNVSSFICPASVVEL